MIKLIQELPEDRYKIKKISDKKLQLEYKIPIFVSTGNEYKIIHVQKIKVRYRANLDEPRHHNDLLIYKRIPIKDRYFQLMSQGWKIKKKEISTQVIHDVRTIGGFVIEGLYTGFVFNSTSWFRDYLLENLLT